MTTKLHDVPNDQEVTLEFEFFDQTQLAINLLLGTSKSGSAVAAGITQPRTFVGALPQKRRHRLVVWGWVLGKFIT